MKLFDSKYCPIVCWKFTRKNFGYTIRLFILIVLISSCTKWYETEDVSHVSQLPRFEINGKEFESFIVADSAEYTDPGAKAYQGETELGVYSYGDTSVDLTKVGVYIVYYYAQNSDGLSSLGERVVAVRNIDVFNRDLSGTYEGTLWSPLVDMKVTKIDSNGFYKCSEVLGYPGTEVKGRFVDMGENTLILIPGNGDFGAYAMSEGSYTLSSLFWTISFLEDPYKNLDIDVVWKKKE
jgi:hypothetical protein